MALTTRSLPQFSIRSILFVTVFTAVVLTLNLRPSVTVGRVLSFWGGPPVLVESVMIERGFPLRYQRVKQGVEIDSGEAVIAGGWPRISAVTSVTHPHWLFANILLAVTFGTLGIWAMSRLAKWCRSHAARRESTNKWMRPSGGGSVSDNRGSTPAAG